MQPADEPPMELITLADGTKIEITRFDCAPAQVQRFVRCFQLVWGRLCDIVQVMLDRHWRKSGLSVVLTNADPAWGKRKKGFASAKPDGTGLFFWAEALNRIPDEVLLVDIAHELGHITFIVIGEPAHKTGDMRSEWLIAELLPEWTFNQDLADDWKLRHIDFDEDEPRWRAMALTEEEFEPQRLKNLETKQSKVRDRIEYREQVPLYYRVATGTCSPELTAIARTDPDRLGRILRREEPDPSLEKEA